jgi:hypothetical protein
MKTTFLSPKLLLIGVLGLTLACSEKKQDTTMMDSAVIDTTLDHEQINLASVKGLKPENRQFVRTAELRFKVANTQKASNTLEDLCKKHGGFVTHSELSSQIANMSEITFGNDSLLRTTAYEMVNDLVIRVPNQHLNELLREIQPLMLFVDKSTLDANDVSFSLLASEARKKRFTKFENNYEKHIATKGKKLPETSEAETTLLSMQNQADENAVETLSLKDQVNYSTVTIHLYQPVVVQYDKIPNIENTYALQPNLLFRIGYSLQTGWYWFEEVLLFFFQIWFVFPLAWGFWWLYKKFTK